MITAEECRRAVDFLVDSAAEYASAEADRTRTENMLRVIKALAMKASGEKSAAAQEREAYASEEYQNAIAENFEATKAAVKLRTLRKAAEIKVDFWRSWNSNHKAAERGFGSAA